MTHDDTSNHATVRYARDGKIERIEPMIDSAKLQARIRELGAQITQDYADRENMVVIGVLKGAVPFFVDLIRHIQLPHLTCDFLGLSSYGSRTASSGVVRVTSDLTGPIEGKHVLVVEDIIDTGLTMDYLYRNLATRRPASVECCTLLHKPSGERIKVDMRYVGFTIPDRFVVGYGLDYAERYRQLPYIGEMHFDPMPEGEG